MLKNLSYVNPLLQSLSLNTEVLRQGTPTQIQKDDYS